MDPLPDRARTGAVPRLHTLVRRRRLVGVALVLAVLAFLVATVHPTTLRARSYTVGSATALVLVDYPISPVVAADEAAGIPLLAFRAKLLADLVMKPMLLDALAARLGVPSRLVVAKPPGLAPPPPGASVSPGDPRAYVVTAEAPLLDGGANPVMTLTTRAPTPAEAARAATTLVRTLSDHLARIADQQATPPARRLQLRLLAPADGRPVRHGRSQLLAAAGAAFLFLLACRLIAVTPALDPRPPAAPDAVGA